MFERKRVIKPAAKRPAARKVCAWGRVSLLTFFGEAKKVSGARCRSTQRLQKKFRGWSQHSISHRSKKLYGRSQRLQSNNPFNSCFQILPDACPLARVFRAFQKGCPGTLINRPFQKRCPERLYPRAFQSGCPEARVNSAPPGRCSEVLYPRGFRCISQTGRELENAVEKRRRISRKSWPEARVFRASPMGML